MLKLLIFSVLMGAGVAANAHRTHVGVYVGVPGPWWGYPAPYYYAPPYYYPPQQIVVLPPAAPTVYVEQPAAAPPLQAAPPAPPQSNDWYYCRSAKAYYPYVRDCPEAWQLVPARPR